MTVHQLHGCYFNLKDKLSYNIWLTSGGGHVSLNAGSMTVSFLKLGSFRLNRSRTLIFTSFGSRSSFLILVGSTRPWYSYAACILAWHGWIRRLIKLPTTLGPSSLDQGISCIIASICIVFCGSSFQLSIFSRTKDTSQYEAWLGSSRM
jgi:hypothetical protein